jgi:antitoxin (DNA-binding transcriptional repressor) of toxin-antitoxin stability system
MKTVTPTQLRTDIYNLLDEVLKTGLPLEIKKGDKVLRVVPVDEVDELAEINWSDEVHLDLP